MTFSEENLPECARIFLKIVVACITQNFDLECFRTSLNEDSKIESIYDNKRIGGEILQVTKMQEWRKKYWK